MGSRTENFIEEPGEHRLAHLSGEWQRAQGSELNAGGNLNLTAGKMSHCKAVKSKRINN